MLPWARSPFSAVALAAVLAACSTPPSEVITTGDPSSSDTSASTTTAMPGTTLTDEGTSASTTTGDTAMDTTQGVVETTTSVTSETSSSSGPSGCMGPADCDSNEECDAGGRCVPACDGTWGEGSYGYCLTEYGDFDTADLCGAGHLCFYWNDPIEQTACALQGCVDACDCPPPPATGNATVTCDDIPDPDGINDCYLSCADEETCPEGMVCNGGGVCMTAVPEVPVYGDCGNLAPECAAPGFCFAVKTGEAVCTMPCTDATECPVAFPPGGNAVPACTEITLDSADSECYLSCAGALSCPDGMTCVNGTLCMWQD